MEDIQSINNKIEANGMAFVDAMITNQEAFYDARANVYDEQNELPARVKRRNTVNQGYHSKLGQLLEGKQLAYLDFGCGTGKATAEFLSGLDMYTQITDWYAMDISGQMVKLAQKNLPQFKVSQGGVSDMNFDGKFDLITSFFHVLCHLDDNDLNLYFKNVARSLKTGGLACFDVIKLFDVGERGYTESDKKEGKKYLAYHSARKDGSKISDSSGNPIIGTDRLFTREEIADFAAANNFKIIDFAEFQIENPDPKIASLKEYQVILQKG